MLREVSRRSATPLLALCCALLLRSRPEAVAEGRSIPFALDALEPGLDRATR